MTKLQSAEEFSIELYNKIEMKEVVTAVKAHDKAVAQVCADAYMASVFQRDYTIMDNKAAILHAIDPPEDTRERLGRVLWDKRAIAPWDRASDELKERYCNEAQAVLTEQRKIEEERDGG